MIHLSVDVSTQWTGALATIDMVMCGLFYWWYLKVEVVMVPSPHMFDRDHSSDVYLYLTIYELKWMNLAYSDDIKI